MDKKQGIKARAQAHKELYQNQEKLSATSEMEHLDETNYINTGSKVFDEYESKYEDVIHENASQAKAIYSGETRITGKMNGWKKMFIVLLILAVVAGIIFAVVYKERYGLSDDVMDVNEYYGTTDEFANDMFIILNNQQLEECYIEESGMVYLPYKLVNDYLNAKIYWDYKENLLLYSYEFETETIDLEQLEVEGYEHVVGILEGQELYVSMEYILTRTSLEYENYDTPNRLVINNNYDEYLEVVLKKDTQVRYRGGVKSEILTELEKGSSVELLEEGEAWHKVATDDGFIGYIPVDVVEQIVSNQRIKTYTEDAYAHTLVDYKICLGWHQTTNLTSNQNFEVIVEGTKGALTTIAPTWFFIEDTLGNISSLATQEYVDKAHDMGMDVWATVNDFDGAIGSQMETYYALNSTSKRQWIIEQLMEEVLKFGIDGINVDIELVSKDAGNHFVQFLRELSIECRANGIVLSVDNYPAAAYNSHYEWSEQADVADYIIIMGYDEYYNGSKQAGPVSSISYTEDGITEMLKYVPAERLVNAIPFYSRLWEEVPKSEEELKAAEGSEDAQYLTKVTSASYGMSGAKAKAEQAGAITSWDYYTKHNYATWTEGSSTFKMWFEDEDAVREKLIVMEQYELAGVAAWKLGIEESSVWELMLEYLEK